MTDVYLSTPAPRRPRQPLRLVTLSVVVTAALVAGIVGVVALSGPDTNTPTDAATGLLNAAGNADVLGVLDHLDPAERDVLSGPLSSITADLKRLGVLSAGADLHKVGGVKAVFSGLTFTTAALRPGLTAVTITGGTVRSHTDPRQIPLGPVVTKQAGAALDKASAHDTTGDLAKAHLPQIVTVRHGGTWYVSIGYTAAEAARRSAGAPEPVAASAVPAVGANSPTQAVDAFLRAGAGLDIRRLIELTPPDEMAALHDYAPLFLPKVIAAVDRLRAGKNAPTVTITDLGLSAHAHAGGQLVKIDRLGATVAVGKVTVSLAPGAKCVTVTGVDNAVRVPGVCGATTASPDNPPGLAGLVAPLQKLTGLRPDLGIMAVERGGKWYVSILRTSLDDLAAVLHALTPDILNSLTTGGGAGLGLLFGLGFAGLAGRNAVSSTSASGFACAAPAAPPSAAPAAPGSLFRPCTSGSSPTGAIIRCTGPAPCPTPTGGAVPPPVKLGPCINGTRTITFPGTANAPPAPRTIPCRVPAPLPAVPPPAGG